MNPTLSSLGLSRDQVERISKSVPHRIIPVSSHQSGRKLLWQWIGERADDLGISYVAAQRRLYRGKLAYPAVERAAHNKVFVV